jgi:Trypsin-co-occurring domain 1
VAVAETEIVNVELPGGEPLLVRVQRLDDDADRPSDIGLREFLSLSHVTASLKGLASELHSAVQGAAPDVVSVELGFDLAIKNSQILAMIVDAGGSASIRVRLEWHGGEPGHASAAASSAS